MRPVDSCIVCGTCPWYEWACVAFRLHVIFYAMHACMHISTFVGRNAPLSTLVHHLQRRRASGRRYCSRSLPSIVGLLRNSLLLFLRHFQILLIRSTGRLEGSLQLIRQRSNVRNGADLHILHEHTGELRVHVVGQTAAALLGTFPLLFREGDQTDARHQSGDADAGTHEVTIIDHFQLRRGGCTLLNSERRRWTDTTHEGGCECFACGDCTEQEQR
mmetsp:Transcript_24945/g.69332  ORF Transcript_24945/g.69332 Transcript_24945/m.69332 type:complete len:217 (-) Transcript_24945:256-906(-)